jgi:predicted Ser/Thr protein kinase
MMALDPSIGSTVGGYRLISLIGRGGMGAVYLADDPRLDRRVALKIPAPQLVADPAFRDRFLRETKLAASLEHPAILPVYAAGEEDGRLFLAMRYVEGSDLAGLIDHSGPIEPRRLVRILSQVASALDAADSHGLVHRDVKPGNILIGPEDQAYLSDFGLTKRQGSGSALTRTGQFVGTLDYVAPEMVEGREVTGKADQYSLACVAFEALTGEPPFRRETDAATLYAHVHDTPPSARLRGQEVPQAVDEVLRRGMAKRPEDRFSSCRAFVEELDRALERPLTKRRSRRAVLAVAVLLGVAIVLAGVVLLSDGDDRQEAAPTPTVSVDEERLLGRIPAPISASCERTTPGVLLPPTSLASMTCIHGAVMVTYSLFDSATAMDDWFNQSIGVVQAFPGDCAIDHKAEGTYTIDLVQAGRVLCYTQAGASYIEWTDEGLLIYGAASREDLSDQDLYVWWADEAGPLTEDKDRSDLSKIPDGIYTMRITPSDREAYAATHAFGLRSQWLGRWVLHLDGGEYQMDAPAEADSMGGSYAAAKNGRVVFEVDSIYCGFFTDVIDWVAAPGALRLTRPSSDSNCGGAPTDLPPWDIHPWRKTK